MLFRVRWHSHQSRLQVIVVRRRTQRVEGGTHVMVHMMITAIAWVTMKKKIR